MATLAKTTHVDPDTQPMTKHIAMRIPLSLAERISDSGVSTSAFIRTAIVDKVRIEEMALKRLGVDLIPPPEGD